jgi:glycosyltransferase involved in cell wall biosynthesis
MHILYIHQHFATPTGKSGTRSYEFARGWVKAGHRVTIITGCYDIGGLESKGGIYQNYNVDGINVIMVGTRYSNKQSYLRRILSFLSFCFLSIIAGLKIKNVDIIYATSTPLTVGITSLVLGKCKRRPYVFEVRDQWPEVPIQLGIIKNKVLIKMLLWLEKIIYRYSKSIVALSPGMAKGIRKVLPETKKIMVIPNSCDLEMFKPGNDGRDIRKRFGWANKLVLMHFGAMGRANGLDFVVDAARKLQAYSDIHFVLAGEGIEKISLIEKIKQLGLSNIEILDAVCKKDLAGIVAACDVAMVIFANYPILENNSANKFFDSLSAGKPVLLNYSGWQREILEAHDAGFGCDLCNIDQFVEKILYFNSHREHLKSMGQNARYLAVENFSRDKLAMQALLLLEEAAEAKRPIPQSQIESAAHDKVLSCRL